MQVAIPTPTPSLFQYPYPPPVNTILGQTGSNSLADLMKGITNSLPQLPQYKTENVLIGYDLRWLILFRDLKLM